jgi:hypothetical protein
MTAAFAIKRVVRQVNLMKQIYTARNLTHCDLVRGMLEASGIPAVLRNEHTCHTAGAGLGSALGFAWPEVWVLHDGDAQDAEACLRQSGFSFLGEQG